MLADPAISKTAISAKPVLKWAGGKRQLLPQIMERAPEAYGTYIEPFFGGGALFFHLQPKRAVIADANAELINLYQVIANDVDALIKSLKQHENTASYFYALRAQLTEELSNIEAASRTLYLNRTCFNGLFRVNKKGQFNVPYGKYVKTNFCDEPTLHKAAQVFAGTTVMAADYKQVLCEQAKAGDFVFLDPPYVPVSKYSDFKRYTKVQFTEQNHIELAQEVAKLNDLGCHVLLTNSNCDLVMELYSKYQIDVVDTRRSINSKGSKREGKDVIVTVRPKQVFSSKNITAPGPTTNRSQATGSGLDPQQQLSKFPPTRFMGSKNKLITPVRDAILSQPCNTVLDLFSGSGVVSYMLKSEGKRVISNDYMAFSAQISKALVENNHVTLAPATASSLLKPNALSDNFVEKHFTDLYFSDDENRLIDNVRANIKQLDDPYEKAIAISALVRACFKKRARGIFTYVGQRYDDGRKDLKITLADHFLIAADALNEAVFDNNQNNLASRCDALDTDYTPELVYIDPPYYSPHSDNEYVRRYHFVEGIACDWQGVDMQWETKTKKFKNYPTPFSTKKGTYTAFDQLFSMYRDSTLVVSYSSNAKPTKDEMLALLGQYKSNVDVVSVNHRYSFGNQGHKISENKNAVSEFIFIAK